MKGVDTSYHCVGKIKTRERIGIWCELTYHRALVSVKGEETNTSVNVTPIGRRAVKACVCARGQMLLIPET